jgi:hypothetical protein
MSNRKRDQAPTVELSANAVIGGQTPAHVFCGDVGVQPQRLKHDLNTREGQRALMLEMADAFKKDRRKYNKLKLLEFLGPWERRNLSTDDTIMSVIVGYLNNHAYPTAHKLGVVMAKLGLSDRQIHHMACDCHTSSADTPAQLAVYLERYGTPLNVRVGNWLAATIGRTRTIFAFGRN